MEAELEELKDARENLDSGWDESRSREALGNVHRRYRRRKVARVAGVAAAVVLLAVGLGGLVTSEPDHLAFHQDHDEHSNFVELADETRVTPLDDSAQISIAEVGPEKVRVAMSKGKAHYEVSKKPDRRFVVELDGVEVEVLGTSFDVEDHEDGVHVHVHEGTVAVRSTRSDEFHVLKAGDEVTISKKPETSESSERAEKIEPDTPAEPVVVEEEVDEVRSKKVVRKPEPAPPKKWRQLTDDKEYERASELLLADPALVDERAVDELFAAADAMRRSGHHTQAADYLEKIVNQHPGDSRSAMAAHTRGRILDRNLAKPCDAAGAFEKAREIGLAGMLQRDALAHSATNWAACGQRSKAAKSARAYQEAYGEGPHWSKLEKFIDADVD